MAAAGKCQLHGVDNVGTVPAAVTAYLAVHEFKPDLVISVGTAGGFKSKGAAIGNVFLATAFANHDRRIPIPVGLIANLWYCNHATSRSILGACLVKPRPPGTFMPKPNPSCAAGL